jgi:hypothetical protein
MRPARPARGGCYFDNAIGFCCSTEQAGLNRSAFAFGLWRDKKITGLFRF